MRSRVRARIKGIVPGGLVRLLVLSLIPILALPAGPMMRSAESTTSNQCVTCHTDAAKLKALTPPDPPAAEAGEG